MGQPKTHDTLEPITLYGRTYPVAEDAVTIPTLKGEVVVTLNNSGLRKDWYYEVTYNKAHFIRVAWEDLLSGLTLIIKKGDVVGAKG